MLHHLPDSTQNNEPPLFQSVVFLFSLCTSVFFKHLTTYGIIIFKMLAVNSVRS